MQYHLYSELSINYLLVSPQQLVHWLAVELGGESMLTINQPWTTAEDGYVTVVSGRLLDVKINTSLEYQPLARAETVGVWEGGGRRSGEGRGGRGGEGRGEGSADSRVTIITHLKTDGRLRYLP